VTSLVVGWLVVGWSLVGWLVIGRHARALWQTVHPRPIVTMEH